MNRTWVAVGAVLVLVALALVLHFTQAAQVRQVEQQRDRLKEENEHLRESVGELSAIAQPFTDADREAIRKVLTEQDAAWNEGKLEKFMEGYWKSPDLTFFSGTSVRRGWDETLARYREKYQGEGKEMGKLTFSDLQIDGAPLGWAWVRGRWQLELKDGTKPGGLFTLILRRFPEGWRIVHDHTSG